MQRAYPMQGLKPDQILPAPTDKCKAINRAGVQCGNRPMIGQAVCRMHGGSSPQAKAKTAERLAMARDLALETLIARVDDEGDMIDPKILLESIIKLTEKVELLEGRATDRKESKTIRDPDEVRKDLESRIDELRERRQARQQGAAP